MTEFNYDPGLVDRLARMEIAFQHMDEKVDRVLNLMDGPNGLVVRLDRAEQQLKGLRHYSHLLAGAVVAALSSKWLVKLFN